MLHLRTIRSFSRCRVPITTTTVTNAQRPRLFTSSGCQKAQQGRQSLISQQTAKEWKDLTAPQKVAAASKVGFNFTIVGVGLVVTAALLYGVSSEFFSSQSPTNIFSDAVDRARNNEQLVDLLGTPMKGHGAPSRNRMKRNRRIQYQIMDDQEGKPHLFLKFYLEGPLSEGTGLVEMVKDEKNKWQYKQLFVDVPGQGLPSRRIQLDKI